ncbi:BrnT family toxin [Pelagovum pacificum]|uniref:BrnT family toxin n=1 Tax=Pelagovum pacificum TaxID=2588711 RepID=A0A5C5GA90_9RHOB|nr:BrnT family toxin [Pelagovum pacificum]QQA45110.1 BrnT family toxin [Pelagovum pacificum]TNY30467.1 BrnT family toxin [Pelagovum pacificum]
MVFEGFDWDDGNWPKCGKHGMTRAEIEEVFLNTPAIKPHPNHSQVEERMKAIGKTDEGRAAYVSFTLRPSRAGGALIRPVSARYMHRKEVKKYEQDN